jgi:hypothetical protein
MSASGGRAVLEGNELEVVAALRVLAAAGIEARALPNPPAGLEPRAGWSLLVAAEDESGARACLEVDASSASPDEAPLPPGGRDDPGDEIAVDPAVDPAVEALLASAPLVHRLSLVARRLGWLAAVLLLLLGLVGGIVLIVDALAATPPAAPRPTEVPPLR